MLQHVIEEMEGRRTGLPVIEKGGWEKRKAVYILSLIHICILEKGWVPFCQIFTDNEASVKLQQKLGLRIVRDTVYWIS